MFSSLLRLVFVLPALATPAPGRPSPSDPNDISGYNKTIFIPYLFPFTSLSTPVISGNIAGSKLAFPVHTGSTGLMIGAPKIPQVKLGNGKPGHEFLDSSNLLYVGRWVRAAITLHGQKLEQAVARVPILVVEKSWYCPWYRVGVDGDKCPNEDAKENDVKDIIWMGVGFGRSKSPEYNPFLNIEVLNGNDIVKAEWRTGYTMGTEGINLGLTNGNTDDAAWVGLEHGSSDDKRDWSMVKTSFTINEAGPYSGEALIDTGIAQMYLQALPTGSVPNVTANDPLDKKPPYYKIQVAKPGTDLKFGFPSLGDANIAGYGFTVGDKKFPSQPYFVQAVDAGPGPFVNTGRKFLWGFTVAFDAVGGRFGFICLRCKKETDGHK